MAKVVCLIGSAASGKDTILNKCVNFCEPIISVTSRKMRDTECGNEYIFCNNELIENYIKKDALVEYRKRIVDGKLAYYGVLKTSIDLDSDEKYIVILDNNGYEKMKRYVGDDNIISIYIECNDKLRMKRIKERQPSITDEEILARFEDDRNTIEKNKDMYDYKFKNEDKEDFDRIVEFIKCI